MPIKRYLLLFFIIIFAIYLFKEPLYTPTALSASPKLTLFPKVIAHKSIISGERQGNSLGAIQEALTSDVDGIEVDVRMSKDNILFLYHGNSLETYTNGTGRPDEYTWNELSKLKYNGKHQEKLVNLEEVFKLVGTKKFICLDVKSETIVNKALYTEISKIIAKYNLKESVFVESFNPFFLIGMRLTNRDILLM